MTTVNNSPVSITEPTQGNGSTPNSLPSPKKVTRQSTLLNTSKNKEESNPYEDLKDVRSYTIIVYMNSKIYKL